MPFPIYPKPGDRFADWMGRSPQDIEEQVTYPLSVQLQGLAGVKTIRSSSEPNFR
jgi:Cu(I)/Ag(I) efflux system membrane protein CusA/SilA